VRPEQPSYETVREEQRREAQRREQEVAREEPRREEPKHEEPRREEPKIDSKALLESSGLVMIETDHSKAQFTPQAEEPPHLGRPRRERPKAQPQDEELQQVETRK
jgi:hypothetical protein